MSIAFLSMITFIVGLSSRPATSGTNPAEVLLKRTLAFPTVLLVLGLYAETYVIRRTATAMGFAAVVLGLAIVTMYRLTQSLLDDHTLHREGVVILRDKLRRSLELAIDERIGQITVL